MNEEIDIIELLRRVKEGNAPKKIEIDDTIYHFTNGEDISTMYKDADSCNWLTEEFVTTKTKIKILDKPIIEKLEPLDADVVDCIEKINEIIGHINKESEEK